MKDLNTSKTEADGANGKSAWAAAVMVACVAAGFGLRAWALWAREVVDFDEAYYYILGRNLVTGKGYVLNGLPHTAFPPLYPVLVGLTSLVTSNMRLATSFVTAVAGALLPIPVYFLGKDVYGRRAGLISAWAVAVWPALFFFSAKYVAYERRLYCGSETLYVTLVVTGCLLLWRFAKAPGWVCAVAAGAFFGLGSLVRSEGPVVFAFLYVWLIIQRGISLKAWSAKRMAQTVLVAGAMVAVMSPFLVHVREVTGRWSLGAKLTNNVRIRDTLWNWARRHKPVDFLKVHYRIGDDDAHMADPYWGVSEQHREEETGGLAEGFRLAARPDWRWLPFFFEILIKPPGALVPWYAWLFIVGAAAICPWGMTRVVWWGLCLAFAAAMMFLAVTLYVLPRHELPLLPLAAVELGGGLAAASVLIQKGFRGIAGRYQAARTMTAGMLIAAVIAAMAVEGVKGNIEGNTQPGRDEALSKQSRDISVADWVKANAAPGSWLMCHEPWTAVWAGMDWRVPPSAGPVRLLRYVKKGKIAYVIMRWPAEYALEGKALFGPYLVATLNDGETLVYDLRKAPGAGEEAGGLPH